MVERRKKVSGSLPPFSGYITDFVAQISSSTIFLKTLFPYCIFRVSNKFGTYGYELLNCSQQSSVLEILVFSLFFRLIVPTIERWRNFVRFFLLFFKSASTNHQNDSRDLSYSSSFSRDSNDIGICFKICSSDERKRFALCLISSEQTCNRLLKMQLIKLTFNEIKIVLEVFCSGPFSERIKIFFIKVLSFRLVNLKKKQFCSFCMNKIGTFCAIYAATGLFSFMICP